MIPYKNPITIPKGYICQDKLDKILQGEDITILGVETGPPSGNTFCIITNGVLKDVTYFNVEKLTIDSKFWKKLDKKNININYINKKDPVFTFTQGKKQKIGGFGLEKGEYIELVPYFHFTFKFKRPIYFEVGSKKEAWDLIEYYNLYSMMSRSYGIETIVNCFSFTNEKEKAFFKTLANKRMSLGGVIKKLRFIQNLKSSGVKTTNTTNNRLMFDKYFGFSLSKDHIAVITV